jgi:hypothetical protein
MAYFDERDDYSLGVWHVELDDLSAELAAHYRRLPTPGTHLSAIDIEEASLNVTLRGRAMFDRVLASPGSLALYVDSTLMDAWDDDYMRHLDVTDAIGS